MSQSPLKANGVWCTFLIFGMLFGITEQTNSSVILSTITSRVSPSPSGNSSLSTTSTFYGNLFLTSHRFARPYGTSGAYYYYQAIRVTVYTSGTYSLTSSSTIDTYGCLYGTTFDTTTPYSNLLAYDDDGGASRQFLISYYLQSGYTYILVVTTASQYVTGSYSLIATGSNSVSMSEVASVTTTRSGYLGYSSQTFSRPNGYSSSYYYNSITVTTYTSGSFTFRSSSISSLDTYGCLYSGSFHPYHPLRNKLVCDDDSAGSLQFQFTQYLSSYNTYILVVTTSATSATGSYVVSATGSTSVSMSTYTPDFELNVGGIVGITIGCIVFCVVIVLSIFLCQRRRQMITRTTVVSAQHYPRAHNPYQPTAYGNVGQGLPPPYPPSSPPQYSSYPKA